MANVAHSEPGRQLYKRQGVVHVCYRGELYAAEPKDAEQLDLSEKVRVVGFADDEGSTVTVKQRRPHKKGLTVTFYATELPPKR